jgi:hypothetical protein
VAEHFRQWIRSEAIALLAVWLLAAAGMVGGNAAYAAGQFRDWEGLRQWENAYRSWLMELAEQVPRGECIITNDTASAVYSNHNVYGHWQLFYEAQDANALRKAMEGSGCLYLVVDDDLRTLTPAFVTVAESLLDPVYVSRDGNREILKLTP